MPNKAGLDRIEWQVSGFGCEVLVLTPHTCNLTPEDILSIPDLFGSPT